MYVGGHAEGRGIYTKANGERDVASFKAGRGGLALVTRIGPPLYKSCHEYCNANIAGCGTVVGTLTAPSPTGQPSPGLDRYAHCASETSECVESCREHNPTTGDVRGIIEIGPLQPEGEPQSPANPKAPGETKGSSESPDFTMEQAGATAALRASIEAQRRELAELKQ